MTNPNHWERLQILGTFAGTIAGDLPFFNQDSFKTMDYVCIDKANIRRNRKR